MLVQCSLIVYSAAMLERCLMDLESIPVGSCCFGNLPVSMYHGREYLCWHTSVAPLFSQSSTSIQDSPPELVNRRRHTMNVRSNERQDSANDQKPPEKATFCCSLSVVCGQASRCNVLFTSINLSNELTGGPASIGVDVLKDRVHFV